MRATLALKVYGENLDRLEDLSAQLKGVIGAVPGVADLSAEANKGKPQMVIKVDRQAASRYGLNADDILAIVQAGIGGETVSTLIDGTRRFDIAVRLADQYRSSPAAIASIPIRTGEGALVPFSAVAKIELDEGYTFVRRESLQRYAVLQMDVQGRDVDGFVRDANAAIAAKVKLPTGYWVEWGGAFENQQRAMARLGLIVPLTIGLIFILLYTAFNSVRHATLIIANVPFAIVGGIVGLFITISVGAVGDRLHRGVRCGDAQRDRARDVPQRPATTRSVDPRCGASRRGLATAPGFDDGVGGHSRPGSDADLQRRRRRDAAPAGHRGGRGSDYVDAADPVVAASDLRREGGPRGSETTRRGGV